MREDKSENEVGELKKEVKEKVESEPKKTAKPIVVNEKTKLEKEPKAAKKENKPPGDDKKSLKQKSAIISTEPKNKSSTERVKKKT